MIGHRDCDHWRETVVCITVPNTVPQGLLHVIQPVFLHVHSRPLSLSPFPLQYLPSTSPVTGGVLDGRVQRK